MATEMTSEEKHSARRYQSIMAIVAVVTIIFGLVNLVGNFRL